METHTVFYEKKTVQCVTTTSGFADYGMKTEQHEIG